MNLLSASPAEGGARIGGCEVPTERQAAARALGAIAVGVRPGSWRFAGGNEGGLPDTVTVIEELGADAYLYGTCDVERTPATVVVRIDARRDVKKGSHRPRHTDPRHVHVFETRSGARLSS